ncbi:MAG TPA: DUF3180 family protein [Mycobacteriales bacterium]|nr:DUF3180 family protein [Mycobacteriales bacterium]
MTPTRLPTLLLCAAVGALLGYLLGGAVYGDLPPLPLYTPITLGLIAVVELGLAKVVRDRVRSGPRRGGRQLHPLQAARAVALAKASSPTGALLAGLYLGLMLWLLPRDAEQAQSDAAVCALSAVTALLLVVAALLLERACRTPRGSDDSRGLGSRS